MKRYSLVFLLIILMLPWMNGINIQAAGSQDVEVTFPAGTIISNTEDPSQKYFLSGAKTITPNDVTVPETGEIIQKVELWDLKNNVPLQQLENVGGNKYRVKSPVQAMETMTVKTGRYPVTIGEGYYEWFRDPTYKNIWMYDYDDNEDGIAYRHYVNTTNIYDLPPVGICSGVTAKSTSGGLPSSYPDSVPCNVAMDYREGYLSASDIHLFLPDGVTEIDPKYVLDMKFDETFTFDDQNGTFNLKQNNIQYITTTGHIDPNTLHYRFNYKATFNVPPDEAPDYSNPNGVVVRWYNSWKLNVVGHVYKYPAMAIRVTTAPPPAKPDLTVTGVASKNACIAVGQSVSFEYSIKNLGSATNTSFKVSIRVDGTEIKSDSYSSLGLNETKTGTFNYTFSSEVEKQITVYVDSDNSIAEDDESNNSRTETFQAKPAGGCDSSQPKPPDLKITGDFTIMNPVIYFGDDNLVQPENISVTGGNGCAYVSHEFTFTQGSLRFYPRGLSPKDANYWFVYDSGYMTYGGGIEKGTVTVYMIINTTCGSSDPIGPKTFEIKTDPNNKPPTIEIAWYKNGKEVTDVVVGDIVDLKVKKEEDPDGDETFRTWLFSEGNTDWIKGLPAASGWKEPYNANSYRNITASVEGSHKVCATIKDIRGNTPERPSCAFLDVKGPTPIPVINGATMVKENRPLNPPLDSLASYSPVTGRTIDHARDEWKSSAVWTDGTTSSWDGISSSFAKTGKVTITLHVFDNTGLKSIAPDYHYITVTPDDPPIIDFQYLSTMSRGPQRFKNKSYSPDGDGIEIYKVTGGYDWSNNGVCNVNETNYSDNNQEFTFNPNRVGNYCFRVYAKEPEWYGKSAYRDYTVQVINDNPSVEFTVTGTASEPMPVNVAGFKATDLVNWTNTSLDKSSMYKSWSVGPNGELVSSKRSQDSSKGPKYYSLPMGNGNMGLNGKSLLTGGTFIEPNVVAIGNDEYIAREYLSSHLDLYLVSPNHSPIKLVYFTYDQNSQVYFNYATDELMIIWTDGPRWATSLYRYEQKWSRWSLATLRSGNTSVAASGDRVVTYGSGPGYKASGKKAEWGDGTRPYQFSRLKFVDDYKEINLTARTITSYTAADKVHPYSTISYDTIPAFPQTQMTGSTPALQYYQESPPDQKLGSTAGSDDHNGILMDAKGNYYAGQIVNGALQIYRFDAFTGIPATVRVVSQSYVTSLTSISEDGNIAGVYWEYYDFDDYTTKSGTKYINLSTGAETGAAATHLEKFDSNSYQNGYGWKNNTLVELSYNTTVTNNSLPLDAKIVSDNQYVIRDSGQIYVYNFNPSEGQPDRSNEPFTFGQLVNTSSQQITNGTILWSMKTQLDHPNMAAGMSFRIQNYQNMYRLESTQSSLRLLKIAAGRKTELKRINRSAANDTWIPYKIKLSGNQIKVYENNSLVMDVTDGTFGSGTLGPFSTADSSQFRSITYQWSNADGSFATPGTAIVDTAVSYDVKYDDPEKDPRLDARTQWMYAHVDTTMFLDIGDGKSGLSAYNGKTVQNQILTFDKVGRYKIDYRVPDDPHPDHRIAGGDLMFQGYSKYSDWYTQYLIVHRRPISNFTILQNGRTKLVEWTDYSYDPDHCYNSGNCQNKADFPTSHGIYKKKFYYVAPSGQRVDGKLIRPTETGTYTVAMAVADEYNAWSDWYEQTIDICSGCEATPNHPPSVTLTFPAGSQSNPTPVSLQPTIQWNQSDPDPNTVFELFDLNVKDEWGGCVECVTNKLMGTTAGSWAWTMDNLLTMGRKYQAQVRVSDGEAWSGWSNVGWMATNSPPAAYMSFPYGTQDNPNIVNTRTPTLTWTQTDPDAGAIFDYYQIQITNEANNVIIFDSGKVWQHTSSNNGSMQVPIELPTGQKLRVRVMVWDQYGAASDWSPQTWMMINRPPKADFDWTPKPAFEGDTVNLVNRSTDPDGDELKFVWQINGPVYYAEPTTKDAVIPGNITDYYPGDYTVTLTATDIHGASDTVTKVVPVGDLNVEGFVRHTDSWNDNRQSYNRKKTGDPERPRPYDMFWSGEAFVLAAVTNQPAGAVQAHMSYTEMDETLLPSSGNIQWSGQMKRDDFETLPDRSYVFRFTAVWPNGHTENADRTITVHDPWTEFTASVRKE